MSSFIIQHQIAISVTKFFISEVAQIFIDKGRIQGDFAQWRTHDTVQTTYCKNILLLYILFPNTKNFTNCIDTPFPKYN